LAAGRNNIHRMIDELNQSLRDVRAEYQKASGDEKNAEKTL
jgi:hypothetical protein